MVSRQLLRSWFLFLHSPPCNSLYSIDWGGQRFVAHPKVFRRNGGDAWTASPSFFSSTSTSSASMTVSSFLGSAAGSPAAPPGAAPGAASAALALYITSASLWLACVSFSCAAFRPAERGRPS